MSFDIPRSIEPQIEQYAKAEKIGTTEAVVRLIKAGLLSLPASSVANAAAEANHIPGLTGTPMSDEEAGVMDEVVESAMQSRNRQLNLENWREA
ncbi:hypothetical protein [Fimbriimonas ginsengisoli]|uniref:Uncharacterized protein n=1 Tax=Fimbriimonas ginsengisoli Gsoil 348 TaxID=661478 RepID=A0A068NRU5_FIMGI|nr:hypothetical protein [Fimbriimonas ginsengisoli]AIE86278.1 hypothetical protein OP10G_2910 [Fimbriimonas ginsengisoli Gsoil 348]